MNLETQAETAISPVLFSVNLSEKQIASFWNKVAITSKEECWLWLGCKNKRGYGSVRINYLMLRANRVSYFIANGPFLDSLLICHRCDNPQCVNPNHLFSGTHTQNVRDMIEKGRDEYQSGLNPDKIRSIRALYSSGTRTMQSICDQFGIAMGTCSFIINRKTWKDVE